MKAGGIRSWWQLRVLTIALMLAGAVAAIVQPAAAQSGDSPGLGDNEYQSPQFDYQLSWQDPWTVTDGSVSSDPSSGDFIGLESPGAFVSIYLLLSNKDPQALLDILLNNIQTGDSNSDFNDLGGDSNNDDFIWTTVDYTFTSSSGSKLQIREYVEVGPVDMADGSGTGLFGGTFTTVKSGFADQWATFNDSVTHGRNSPVFVGTPEGVKKTTTKKTPTPAPKKTPTKTPTKKTPTPKSSSKGEPGITENSYLAPQYGFSVTWDDQLWKAEDAGTNSEDAIVLTGDTSQIQLRSYQADGATVRTCVNDNSAQMKDSDGVSDFARASSDYTVPEFDSDAYGRLYSYTYTSGQSTVDFVHYFECRPLTDDAFLLISFLSIADNYEDNLADYQDVIDTIKLEGNNNSGGDETPTAEGGDNSDIFGKIGKKGNGDKTPTPSDETSGPTEPKLSGNKYTGGAYKWSVTWDKSIWTAEALDPTDSYEGVKLTSDSDSVWVEAYAGNDGDPDTCVSDSADQLSSIDGVSGVKKNRTLDLPETDGDAAAIYTYTYEGSNGPVDLAEYFDCRVLVEGSVVLRLTVITTIDLWPDQVQDLSDLLSGIKLGGSSSSGTSGNSGNSSGNSSNTGSSDTPGVKGRTYTSPQYDYSVKWDKTWNVDAATDGRAGTTLTLSNGVSTIIISGSADYSTDPAECVQDRASETESADGVTSFKIVKNNNGDEQTGGDDTYGFGIYSYVQDGDVYFDFIQCNPAPSGDFVVAIEDRIPLQNIADESTALTAVLQGLTIEGEPAAGVSQS